MRTTAPIVDAVASTTIAPATAAATDVARLGSFSGPTFAFGAPLEIVHPQDNVFPQFDPEIEGLAGATLEERARLQAELDALFAVLISGRDER